MERDQVIFDLIEKEHQRQLKGMELIASENFVSDEVMEAMGSYLTNKYAEGYPGKRYYGGCQVVDEVETLAIERVCKLFAAEYKKSCISSHRNGGILIVRLLFFVFGVVITSSPCRR